MLSNEVNELAIDEPIKLATALNQVKIKANPTSGPRSLSKATIEALFKNKEFRPILVKLIAQRHTSVYVNAGGGTYDKSTAGSDTVLADLNVVLESPEIDKATALKIAEADVKAKMVSKGLKQNVSVGKVIFAGLIIGGIVWGVCKLVK